MYQFSWRGLAAASLTAAVLAISPCSRAVTILSGPTFTPATNAPLAGLLQLTTDVNSRVSVLVSDGTNTWERDFYDYNTTHSVPLLGFKPGRTNEILVTVYDEDRNSYTAPQPLTFVTAPLPGDFPVSTVLTDIPSEMEPGYMLFTIQRGFNHTAYVTIIDDAGNVVWYMPVPALGASDVHFDYNGDLFIEEQQTYPTFKNDFLEVNMLGQVVQTWTPPDGYPVNPHEGLLTDHGTILYISDATITVSNFPSSDTDPNAPLETVNMDDEPIVELSAANGELLNSWSLADMLDPTRITYLSDDYYSPFGVDNFHANAIIDDTNDSSLIVSSRDQNAVFKFTRAGQLKWILSEHANWPTNFQQYLLTPVSTPFEWNYGQHGPDLTLQGTLLVYNDGPKRASPYDPPVPDQDNHSDAVEYAINETNMTVSEVWNSSWQTNQDRLYTPIVGKTQWLPQTRNVLVTYGFITYINGVHPSPYSPTATMARIIEYTHDPVPQIVFDISYFDPSDTTTNSLGYATYRATWIPDLYVHPPEPVTNLTLHDSDGDPWPVLEFSADPAHNYVIQASGDMVNWRTIGTPIEEDGIGDFDFYDLSAGGFNARFYRVVTQ